MHIPVQGDPKESEDTRDRDRKFLLNLGTQYDYEASVSGHSHIMYWSKIKPNHWHWNMGTLSGSWWSGQKTTNGLPKAMMQDGTPPGAGLFQGWPLEEQFRYVPIQDHPQLKVLCPQGLLRTAGGPTRRSWCSGLETQNLQSSINGVKALGGKAQNKKNSLTPHI